MREPQPNIIQLKDYSPPAFLIDSIDLDVDIREDDALVKATLAVRRNPTLASFIMFGPRVEVKFVVNTCGRR
jgi:aminopeptidase N